MKRFLLALALLLSTTCFGQQYHLGGVTFGNDNPLNFLKADNTVVPLLFVNASDDVILRAADATGVIQFTNAADDATFVEIDVAASSFTVGPASNNVDFLVLDNSGSEIFRVDGGSGDTTVTGDAIFDSDVDVGGNIEAVSFLPANLVGYWPLTEGTGTAANDLSLNSNTGTITAGAGGWSSDSPFRQSYEFDSADTVINCGSDSTLDAITTVTLAAWVKADGYGETSGGRIIDKGHKLLLVSSTEKLRFIHLFSGTNGDWTSDSNALTLDAWHFVVVTYDNTSTSNAPVFYIDGQSVTVNEDAAPTGTADSDAGQDFKIGNNWNATITFDGHICEAMVFDRILSAEEVQRMYRAPSENPTLTDLTVNGDTILAGNVFLTQGTDSIISRGTADGADSQFTQINGGGGGGNARGAEILLAGNEQGSVPGVLRLSAGNVAGGDIEFYAGAGLRALIDENGNVGIGTASPGAELEVQAGTGAVIRVSSSDASLSSGELLGVYEFYSNDSSTNGAGVAAQIRYEVDGGWNGSVNEGHLGFLVQDETESVGTLTEVLSLNNDGNVGIGTATPAFSANAKGLDIAGTGGQVGAAQDGTERIPTLRITDTVGDYGSDTATVGEKRGAIEWYSTESSHEMPGISAAIYNINENSYNTQFGTAFYTFNAATYGGDGLAERMRISNAGNVGVGTASPNALLEVEGDSNGEGGTATPIVISISDTATGSSWDLVNSFAALDFKSADASGSVGTRTRLGTKMTLADGGTTDLAVWMNQGSLVETASFGRSGDFTIGRVGGTGIAPAIAMLNIEGYDNDALRSIIRYEDENANVDFLMTTNTNGAALNMFFRGDTELAGNLEVDGDAIIGSTAVAPDGTLHVFTGSAGSVTASAGADDFVVESNASVGLSLLGGTGTAGAIYFGTGTTNLEANLVWDASANEFRAGPIIASSIFELYSGSGGVALTLDSSHIALFDATIKLKEVSAAPPDTTLYGQLWVKDTTPQELWFTDEAGLDTQIL